MASSQPRRALISVSDKTGIREFAAGLRELGFDILSTGGTSRTLQEAGIPVVDVADYTGFPEMMDGRVKTLHPKVHGAILGRPDLPADAAAFAAHGIVPFALVVCNLYPFEQTVARPDVSLEDAIEQIDIGGPSMIRSAAKNHAYVAVVTSPDQYGDVLAALRENRNDLGFRRGLALAAFQRTAAYDRAIVDYLAATRTRGFSEIPDFFAGREFPPSLNLAFQLRMPLRYGENPHQAAAFYRETDPPAASLAAAEQRHGKELSYNNLLDLDAALNIVRDFAEPAAVVIKHTNPCGCAVDEDLAAAFRKAYAGDPVSAFGSILGFNRPVNAAVTELLCEPNRFIEAIIAPAFDEDAFEMLTTRPKWKNNVRLLTCPGLLERAAGSLDLRRVTGGLLVQDRDDAPHSPADWKCATRREPTAAERRELEFAWTVCRQVKSNAIVFAKDRSLVGVGAGQMSRLDACFLAAHKAGDRGRGAVLGSDAFFPFRDGIDEAANAGVTAVVQPGGSRNDEEVIAACNEHGIAMLFTGRRHFRH
jgi:phosphoribosylaminoimidazolecarboxamide formyltransferase / IMP cyclohydrolase